MTNSEKIAKKVYATPVSCAVEIDYLEFIAASNDLRDMDVKTMYDEDF